MSSNNELQAIHNQGWLQGFANLFRKENYLWWRTSRWLVQILIWLAIANGILFAVIGIAPHMKNSSDGAMSSQAPQDSLPSGGEQGPMDLFGLSVFLKMAGITLAIGVVILGQGTMIDENQSGTTPWVLSKPVARASFILSKVFSHAIGVLATMVVAQGGAAYAIIYLVTGKTLPVLPFAGACGMLFLALVFWLTLTVMLSTLSNLRGLVMGVPLIFILGYSLFVELLPWTGNYMPWNLTSATSAARPAMAVALVMGQPLTTLMPIFASLAGCALFILVAIWRFQNQEF